MNRGTRTQHMTKIDTRVSQKELITAVAGAVGEWLFAMLPIVVVMIVMAHLEKISHMADSPEWAFGASILAGQTIARFVAGVHYAGRLSLDRVLLGISALSVVIVVPANIILVLVVLSVESETKNVSDLLSVLQIILFGLASIAFVLVATFAHLWAKKGRSQTPHQDE